MAARKLRLPIITSLQLLYYLLLRDLMSRTLSQEATFDNLAKVLEEYYEPQPLVIAERFKFHNC